MSKVKISFVALGVAVLIAGLAVAGWKGGWWLQKQANTNQYQVDINGGGGQQAIIQKERDYVTQIGAANDPGQKLIITRTFCQSYTELNQPPLDLQADFAQPCN